LGQHLAEEPRPRRRGKRRRTGEFGGDFMGKYGKPNNIVSIIIWENMGNNIMVINNK